MLLHLLFKNENLVTNKPLVLKARLSLSQDTVQAYVVCCFAVLLNSQKEGNHGEPFWSGPSREKD
jgi:hypothetical protein